MKILKYIINKRNMPIVFSPTILHNEILQEGQSAGYVTLKLNKNNNLFTVKCFGESSTLKIGIADGDEILIEEFLNKQFL
jgi:hypothetical protein